MLMSPSNGNHLGVTASPPPKSEDLDDTTDPSLREADSQYSAPVEASDGSSPQPVDAAGVAAAAAASRGHNPQTFNGLDTLMAVANAEKKGRQNSSSGLSQSSLSSLSRMRAEPYGHPQPQPLPTGPMSISNLTNPVSGQKGAGAGRKKKQCPTCQGWFSNLATHRSIHLADNSRPHTCDVCGRGFARPNDLFRHQKSHRGDAPFRCPLFTRTSEGSQRGASLQPACHQNGGFSRCDTYKNHLKAMHFEYPAGTKKRERPGMGGRCKGCGLAFTSTDEWIAEHIEPERCEGIKRVQAINAAQGDYHSAAHAAQDMANNFAAAELAAAAAGLAAAE